MPDIHLAPPAPDEHFERNAAEYMFGKLGERIDRLAESVDPYSRLKEHGGVLSFDRRRSPYDFAGARHVALNQYIQENLWRFRLANLDRGVLDYMATNHNEDGLVNQRQVDLARLFECSQPRVHRAITCLRGYHFVWMPRRAWYQLHPQYAYRFGSEKQHAVIKRLGQKLLEEHTIEIPGLGRAT